MFGRSVRCSMMWLCMILLSSSIIPVTLRKRVAKRLKMCLGSQVDVAPSADVQQFSPNKDNKIFPKGESLSTFLTMQMICLAARYVESPSLASAQIGPFTFSPNSWVFQYQVLFASILQVQEPFLFYQMER